jgi:hypothetical protein
MWKMIRAIALRFGYVENNTLSWFIFQSEVGFKTKKEAFHSLAEFVYQRYLENKVYQPRECCKESGKDPAHIFCSNCGTRLSQLVFSYLEWAEDLEAYRMGIIDGNSDKGIDNPDGWDPANYVFNISPKNMMLVHELGVEMLSLAVVELHPELKEEIYSYINDYWLDDYQELLNEGQH